MCWSIAKLSCLQAEWNDLQAEQPLTSSKLNNLILGAQALEGTVSIIRNFLSYAHLSSTRQVSGQQAEIEQLRANSDQTRHLTSELQDLRGELTTHVSSNYGKRTGRFKFAQNALCGLLGESASFPPLPDCTLMLSK